MRIKTFLDYPIRKQNLRSQKWKIFNNLPLKAMQQGQWYFKMVPTVDQGYNFYSNWKTTKTECKDARGAAAAMGEERECSYNNWTERRMWLLLWVRKENVVYVTEDEECNCCYRKGRRMQLLQWKMNENTTTTMIEEWEDGEEKKKSNVLFIFFH